MQDPKNLVVMSYNIRYDTPNDGLSRWDLRKEKVVSLLDYYHADIIGMQEALLHQIKFLESSLEEYKWVGVGRDDGNEGGEYSPVFYNSTKLEIDDWGTFWLSSNPDSPSRGWDAALPRICTWVKFRQISNGRIIYFLNTHFDHRGEEAREMSSKLIMTKVAEIAGDSDIVLVGDFNQTPDSPGYQAISRSMSDTRLSSAVSYGPSGTFSGFESGKELGDRIDYIFASKSISCNKYRVITDHDGQRYPSDHLPVIAYLVLGR